MMNKKKIFAVISLGWLGDTLLNSTLVQDIKANYPDSKVIFIVSKPFIQIAKGLPGVDEVFYYDKANEHKSFLSPLVFARKFPYRNKIDCAFITHAHERSIILGYVIGAKKRVALSRKMFSPLNLLITHKIKYNENKIRNTYKADYTSDYLNAIGAKSRLCDVKFEYPVEYDEIIKNKLTKNGWDGSPYVVLSPLSKDEYKDWEANNVEEFISKMNALSIPVVIVGTGKAEAFVNNLKNVNFISMVNKTDIFELAALFKNAKASVSVDTGTMHLSYAVGTPTICLFFVEGMIAEWAPKDRNKNRIICSPKPMGITADMVVEKLS